MQHYAKSNALLPAWLPRRRKLGGGRSSEQNSSVDDVTALGTPEEDSGSGSGSDEDYVGSQVSAPLPDGTPAAVGAPTPHLPEVRALNRACC